VGARPVPVTCGTRCIVRASEQINGDNLVVIHFLLSKSGEHSVHVGGVGLSVNLKGRHRFKVFSQQHTSAERGKKTGNPKLRI